jgi:hypothetical protein
MNSKAHSENPLKRVKEFSCLFFNPLWVLAISLGIHSEVDCDSDDEFRGSIFQSPGIIKSSFLTTKDAKEFALFGLRRGDGGGTIFSHILDKPFG